jgi:hypothetical protein
MRKAAWTENIKILPVIHSTVRHVMPVTSWEGNRIQAGTESPGLTAISGLDNID